MECWSGSGSVCTSSTVVLSQMRWDNQGSHSFVSTGFCPDSKVHGANMGPIWGQQDPGGPHVGPMNFAIWAWLQENTWERDSGIVLSSCHCAELLLGSVSIQIYKYHIPDIWQHRSGSTLAQIMVCCLTALHHYLNQSWLFISKVQWHSCEGNFTRDISGINHINYLENDLFKIQFQISLGPMSQYQI